MSLIREFFKALLELIGPMASVLLAIWEYAAFWHNYNLAFTLAVPFTGISVGPEGVRWLLVVLYMAIQFLLVVALYGGQRAPQTLGRNIVELLFSMIPLVILVAALWWKESDKFVNWEQRDSDLWVGGVLAVVLDILLTWFTATNPSRRPPV